MSDNERRTASRDLAPVRVLDSRLMPHAIFTIMEDLRVDRLGQNHDARMVGWRNWSYQYGIRLALEQLRQHSHIPDNAVFNIDGSLRMDTHPHDAAEAFGSEGVLKGKKVIVFGGPEAEIFKAMGAEAIGFDPKFKDLPDIKWEADQRARKLEDAGREISPGWADLTYSSRLFDDGSGLVLLRRYKNQYVSHLETVLKLTKPGGLSIRDGMGVFDAIYPDLDYLRHKTDGVSELEAIAPRDVMVGEVPVRVVEIIPYRRNYGVGEPLTTYVLQRKAA